MKSIKSLSCVEEDRLLAFYFFVPNFSLIYGNVLVIIFNLNITCLSKLKNVFARNDQYSEIIQTCCDGHILRPPDLIFMPLSLLIISIFFFYFNKEFFFKCYINSCININFYRLSSMNQTNKKNIKNALAYLSTTVLNKGRLEKLMFQNPYFLQNLEFAMKKNTFKAVKMVAAFINAKAFLSQDEIQRFFTHFRSACEQKIRLQEKRLSSNRNERIRYINVVRQFAKYMAQLLEEATISEEFIHNVLAFIFWSNAADGRGRSGRTQRQDNKISSSLRYLREIFPDFISRTETGMQTDDGRADEQVEQLTERLELFEEWQVEQPREQLGFPYGVMINEDISIFLVKEVKEDQISEF